MSTVIVIARFSIYDVIFQVILPALLEQTQARHLLKIALRAWCRRVGAMLGLVDYLLSPEDRHTPGENVEEVGAPVAPPVVQPGAPQGLAAQHQVHLSAYT